MKQLFIFLLFLGPSKFVHFDSEVTFKRDTHGFWESGNVNDAMYMSANPEIWLINRQEGSKMKAGYCRFKQPNNLNLIKVIAIFPQPGFKMKQNLFTYIVVKGKNGTR